MGRFIFEHPVLPPEEEPHPFIPQGWLEWVTVVFSTAGWWTWIYYDPNLRNPVALKALGNMLKHNPVPHVNSVAGWLLYGYVLGTPILIMLGVRGLAWMRSQRIEAKRLAERRARRKPSPIKIRYSR